MLLLIEMLIEMKGFDFRTYHQKMLGFAHKFLNHEIPDRGYGHNTIRAFQNLVEDITPSGGNSPSCGAAMKIGPIGLFYADSPPEIICNIVKECAQLTHIHPESISGACAIAMAVATATQPEATMQEILASGIEAAEFISNGIASYLRKTLKRVQNSKEPLYHVLQTGFSAKKVVGVCFGILSRFSDYKGAIEQAINIGGDTDSYATMIGSILGAKNGIDCIPTPWLESLEAKEGIQSLATQLFLTSLEV